MRQAELFQATLFIGRYVISYDLNKENETVQNGEEIRYEHNLPHITTSIVHRKRNEFFRKIRHKIVQN